MQRTPLLMMGAILLVLGAVALIWQKVSYTERDTLVDIGSVKVTADNKKDVPLPPILGGIALAGGAILLAVGAGKS